MQNQSAPKLSPDGRILYLWNERRIDTAEIAARLRMPEGKVEARLWRLLEASRPPRQLVRYAGYDAREAAQLRGGGVSSGNLGEPAA